MRRRFCLLCLAVFCAKLLAQPVESEMDKPLDLSRRWSFYSNETVYLQHQCSPSRARDLAMVAQKFFAHAESHLERRELVLPLQMRLYANAEQYRRTLRFSRQREAHYNPRLAIVAAHCGISAAILEEQLALFWLAEANLRTWQRLLLAEALPRMAQLNNFRLAIRKDSVKPMPVIRILLSDHILEEHERIALARFIEKIAAKGKLREFLIGIYHNRLSDSTGLDTLEALFPGSAAEIVAGKQPLF